MRARVTSDGTPGKTKVMLLTDEGQSIQIGLVVEGATWSITAKGQAILHLSLAPLNEASVWGDLSVRSLMELAEAAQGELDRRRRDAIKSKQQAVTKPG